jgi:sulfur-oxidizing protein SoxZ
MSNVLINAPKTAKPGEVIEIKALIMHPMETGFRPGTNGRIIPRNIIERFVATWNDREIFSMAFSPAIAANPFVSFFTVAKESGTVRLRWTGDENFNVEEKVDIAVG